MIFFASSSTPVVGGRVERKIDAPFNKGVAVCLLLQRDGGETRFFLAGLGGEGENAYTPTICVLEELLAGHGGEEELSRVIINASASWRPYPFCYWCGGSAPQLFLSAGRGGEGEGSDGAAASLYWRWWFLKLSLRRISSVGDSRRRYLWPRRPRRSSAVPAPGSFYFPHTLRLWRKISNPSSAIHPGGEPSGVVPASSSVASV
jgi:hypothetical protein